MFRRSLGHCIATALPAAALLALLPLAACTMTEPAATAAAEKPPPSIVGETTRAAVEAAEPAWVAAEVDAVADAAAARALAEVAPGAEVTVFFGTWCGDSKRELSRLWRAFDDAGVIDESELPFTLDYVAVDRAKVEPAALTAGIDLRYVPTFIVRRDGREVGRLIEESPHGIEHDLLALLSGEATGVVSMRDDVGAGDGGG